MSTDVLRFTDNHQVFDSKALPTYLAISLPMMALTFIAWFSIYRFARYRENYTNGILTAAFDSYSTSTEEKYL